MLAVILLFCVPAGKFHIVIVLACCAECSGGMRGLLETAKRAGAFQLGLLAPLPNDEGRRLRVLALTPEELFASIRVRVSSA